MERPLIGAVIKCPKLALKRKLPSTTSLVSELSRASTTVELIGEQNLRLTSVCNFTKDPRSEAGVLYFHVFEHVFIYNYHFILYLLTTIRRQMFSGYLNPLCEFRL